MGKHRIGLLTLFLNFELMLVFLEVNKLLAYGEKKSFVISDFEFNQTDAVRSVSHLCSRLKEVSRFASGQEVDVVLEGDSRFSEAVSGCFAGLIGN
jgi:hypothetical protein